MNKKQQFAVAIACGLAELGKTTFVTISDLSEHLKVSVSYLEHSIRPLREAGLIVSQRGPGGGYRLARDPAHISIAEIIDAIEPPRFQLSTVYHAALQTNVRSYLVGVHIDELLPAA